MATKHRPMGTWQPHENSSISASLARRSYTWIRTVLVIVWISGGPLEEDCLLRGLGTTLLDLMLVLALVPEGGADDIFLS